MESKLLGKVVVGDTHKNNFQGPKDASAAQGRSGRLIWSF